MPCLSSHACLLSPFGRALWSGRDEPLFGDGPRLEGADWSCVLVELLLLMMEAVVVMGRM